MGVLGWVGLVVGAAVLFYVVQTIYLGLVLSWENEQTRGAAYYGRTPAERARFKATLRRHARLLRPILRLSAKSSPFDFAKASFEHRGVTGPRGTCSPESFAAAAEYRPTEQDVFVATQMKCGTTWMQHLVYEILHRGNGDLVATGKTLYGVCPWIEGIRSVPMAEAPLHGAERPSRIIKTHLPIELCPFDPKARYVYVVRHPISCFASCADFISTNAGAMAPPLEWVEEWFCSDRMWWSSWPAHVHGWLERSRAHDNVLLVSFEEMKRDLAGVARQVAGFLGLAPLDQAELSRVVEKCGFRYMQEHQDAFEMNPPHLLQTEAELFVRGTADRHRDVPDEARARVAGWCREASAARGLDLPALYSDLG